jgi:hypothetical protein
MDDAADLVEQAQPLATSPKAGQFVRLIFHKRGQRMRAVKASPMMPKDRLGSQPASQGCK